MALHLHAEDIAVESDVVAGCVKATPQAVWIKVVVDPQSKVRLE
jgi:hypothetical protein